MGRRALLEQLAHHTERAAAVIRQRTREAAGGIVRVSLPHRSSNVDEILPSVLEHELERSGGVVDFR